MDRSLDLYVIKWSGDITREYEEYDQPKRKRVTEIPRHGRINVLFKDVDFNYTRIDFHLQTHENVAFLGFTCCDYIPLKSLMPKYVDHLWLDDCGVNAVDAPEHFMTVRNKLDIKKHLRVTDVHAYQHFFRYVRFFDLNLYNHDMYMWAMPHNTRYSLAYIVFDTFKQIIGSPGLHAARVQFSDTDNINEFLELYRIHLSHSYVMAINGMVCRTGFGGSIVTSEIAQRIFNVYTRMRSYPLVLLHSWGLPAGLITEHIKSHEHTVTFGDIYNQPETQWP
jgi:hypothetical protein